MSTEIKVQVLDIKSLTHFIVKEVETKEAKEFVKLEDEMQSAYSLTEITAPKEELEIGSFVCVYANTGPLRKSPKKWMRAVVRNVFLSVGTYLFDVDLLDYGLHRVVKRTDVREMKPQFSDQFSVGHQVINFHLADVKSKDKITSEEKKTLEDLFKQNNNLVLAQIRRQIKANRTGLIRLNDGSDLGQYLVAKELLISNVEPKDKYISNTMVRKPMTSPKDIFKCVVKPIAKTRELPKDEPKNIITSDSPTSSVSSISSVELPINSDDSEVVLDTEEEDSTLNFATKLNISKKTDINTKVVNGLSDTNGDQPSRKQKLQKFLNQIKLRNESQEKSATNGSGSTHSTDSEADIKYVTHYNSKDDDEIDWPLKPTDRNGQTYQLQPAGMLPPPEVLQRILTLKTQKKY